MDLSTRQSLSVVLPTFNGARYLAETVGSVCAQTRTPDELVIVDDRSSDSSVDIAVEVCRQAGLYCRVHRRETNSGGPVLPLNEGIALARGAWIALIDQDDLWMPERLEKLFGGMNGDSGGAELLFNDVAVFDKDVTVDIPSVDAPSLTVSAKAGTGGGLIDPAKAYAYLLTQRNFVHTASNMVFTKSAWVALEGFNPRFRVCWDVEFLLRAFCRLESSYVRGVLTRHRFHPSSLSRSSSAESREMTVLRDHHAANPLVSFDSASLMQRISREWWDAAYEASRTGDVAEFWRAWRRSWQLGQSRLRLLGLAAKLPGHLLAASRRGAS